MWDSARFYPRNGEEYPSVTTILSVISKPALGPWYAKEERRVLLSALLDVLTSPHSEDPQRVMEAVEEAAKGIKAGERIAKEAADIGTAAHAYIHWLTKTMLGEDPGPEPVIPEAAQIAVMSWQDWANEVSFRPLFIERVVYSDTYKFAGTFDFIGEVKGRITLGDYKTGKAVYPESFLQNIAYRYAAAEEGLLQSLPFNSYSGLILRLPKTLDDPQFEAVEVPPETNIEDFLACQRLWAWQRRTSKKKEMKYAQQP